MFMLKRREKGWFVHELVVSWTDHDEPVIYQVFSAEKWNDLKRRDDVTVETYFKVVHFESD